ncbi:PREDICTED: transmembrane protein 71, partial [Merops nubicus]|uniref:transmembrane protein 71 n=1 Tax=Merops nubicus TaxID=57421 RepID=UPI0004F011FA
IICIVCYAKVYETILFKMYGTSHVASTPGGSSTAFNREHRCSLSPPVFPSSAHAFLDDDRAYECCSTSPLTGCLASCRRSPRLLSNGYYILTADSLLCDEEGNITLTPSQTSVTYKENLIRVFRRRKKIRRSLTSLFSLSASSSWLSSTILSNRDSSRVYEPWPDGCNQLEASESDIVDSDVSAEYISHVPRGQTPASNGASLTKDEEFLQPGKPFCASQSCSPFMINANEETLSSAKSRTARNILSQIFAVIICLIISIGTRYFLGGLSATLLLIIVVFLLSQDAAVSSFFSFDTSFRTTKFCLAVPLVCQEQPLPVEGLVLPAGGSQTPPLGLGAPQRNRTDQRSSGEKEWPELKRHCLSNAGVPARLKQVIAAFLASQIRTNDAMRER